jgi:hypothetical protein
MYKIEFYVPETHLEIVKEAMFEKGAGKIGLYDSCCWQIKGSGQFRPGLESHPHIGSRGTLEKLDEWKVEMVCSDDHIKQVYSALMASHPYEEPAYNIVKILDKSMFL